MKTKIETTAAVRRFNFLVGHFDGLTGGKYDRVLPDQIITWYDARGQAHYAAELRELCKVIYGN